MMSQQLHQWEEDDRHRIPLRCRMFDVRHETYQGRATFSNSTLFLIFSANISFFGDTHVIFKEQLV